jgi:hypothetical protein
MRFLGGHCSSMGVSTKLSLDLVTFNEWRYLSHFRRLSFNWLSLHIHFTMAAVNNHDFGKSGTFGGKWPPKIGVGLYRICGESYRRRNTSFDVLKMKIGPYLLVVIGIEGEKKMWETHKCIFHHSAQTTPCFRSRPFLARLVTWTR